MPEVFLFLEPCTVNSLTGLYFNFKEFATLALFHSVIITQVQSRECLVIVDNDIADMLLLNVAYRVYIEKGHICSDGHLYYRFCSVCALGLPISHQTTENIIFPITET